MKVKAEYSSRRLACIVPYERLQANINPDEINPVAVLSVRSAAGSSFESIGAIPFQKQRK
jgi:hypothetical protein